MKLTLEIRSRSKKEILKHLLTVMKLLMDNQYSQSTVHYNYKLESGQSINFNENDHTI